MRDNQHGITLVELLGVLAILSIILLLIGSAHIFGQKQLVYQTDEVNQQNDVRLVVSQLTTDFRSTTADKYIEDAEGYHLGSHVYKFNESSVFRNGEKLSDNIARFELAPIKDDADVLVGVDIVIESLLGGQGSQTTVETAIYFRK
ncbi:prepilin-type N-terminal cleavage/methylation domain-containing protein [Amphibacillus xylanus]|uniref:Prepilin-type N-terminal cleavage/methylation domain-containing protein n=1 Tax=Amphibacillus xylanus (strain ATCC 51415 / DSM 6626 / JCM 7361 / LMG 17667 / NBRC 15112 / Ep01) TaxID=698758 RepID=K0J774_AMPXN|nr:prepilin-type N-terminal cleavage/methylation domain-containing protein [Amphibacillus xylanus]BAM47133.1 hypothetical protein AXY_10010 [Amphibacillus xylanus NBRC 15112]